MVVRKIFCGMNFKKQGFTLSEVLIAIVIVGVIAGLVLPILLTHFQEKALEHAYTREVNAIADAVSALSVAENTSSFFETMMYENEPTEDYSSSSGLFMKKYLRIAKDCGNSNGNCFAKKYYEYKDKTKADYTPEYKGYCASLKNGVSICMTPQTGGADITGIMDLNGPKGPNILGKDLRPFTIDPKYKSAIDRTADDVIAEDPYLVTPKEPECSSCDCDPKFCPPTNACDANPNGLECCQTRAGSIASPSDPCCSYPAIKSVQSVCTEPTPTPPCTSCDCNPAFCPPPPESSEPPAQSGDDVCTNCGVCTNAGAEFEMGNSARSHGLRTTFRGGVYCDINYYCMRYDKSYVVDYDRNYPDCRKGFFRVQRHYVWDCKRQDWHLLSGVYYISSDGTVSCDESDIDGTCVNNQTPNDALFQAAYQGYTQGTVDGTFYKDGKWYTYDRSTKSFKLKK